ncbi:hypothetical protein [Aestuariivita sp.]|uniref:hypothetical protein n=1 Tax=Aestuariivita sp. TaxID=1872407 RepID=UPI00216DF76C|nr:hypothetical protein [Aestuariivita sp.]MCE8005970.1 hypothetical protein [Aestuariivita sp.]
MGSAYETFELVWQERRVEVSFQFNWLGSDFWHIELRSPDVLPLTETGYRSCFVPSTDDASEQTIRNLVLHWLDDAADTERWQSYLNESRQLSLF